MRSMFTYTVIVQCASVDYSGCGNVYRKFMLVFFQKYSKQIDRTAEMLGTIFESKVVSMARNAMTTVTQKIKDIFRKVF